MATYCTVTDVAAEFPWLTSFTPTSRPATEQVERYITEAANEMETAIESGGHYELEDLSDLAFDVTDSAMETPVSTDANKDSEAAQWLKETNVQGALQRIGRFLYSFGRGGDSGRIPWQDDFAMRVKQLRDGAVQWDDAKVEPSTKQIPPLRQRFG